MMLDRISNESGFRSSTRPFLRLSPTKTFLSTNACVGSGRLRILQKYDIPDMYDLTVLGENCL